MKKRSIIAFILFILLTTITSKQEIIITKFNIKEIKIENNSLLKTEDIIESLKPIYNKNGKVLKGPNFFKPNLSKFVA